MKRRNAVPPILPCLSLLYLLAGVAGAGEWIWVEGEAASESSMTRHPWWYDKVKKEELSGGAFLSNWSPKPGEASYAFEVSAAREYALWIRANPVATLLSYRLDGGAWQALDLSLEQQGNTNIAADEKPDLRFLAWSKAGPLRLGAGRHTLSFRMHSANNNHGMLDCFVLTPGLFKPNGKFKPGEGPREEGRAEEGRWAFRPPPDEFNPAALLDLRGLNEKVAGENGFVACSRDGEGFVLGSGKPVRFWAVNDDAHRKHPNFPAPDLARHARFLAKRGVNLVRFFCDISSADQLDGINEEVRDRLWKTVAAMKKEGIYVLFTPLWIGQSKLESKLGFLDDGGNQKWGLLFFDSRLQQAYKSWMRQVFTVKNPYTGIPLRDDPALAILQIQNEDSLLFWTSQKIKGPAKAELRRQFGAFLCQKYGSLEQARQAWGPGCEVGADQDLPDDFAKGEAALFIVWEMTRRQGGEARQRRLNDQFEFFCRTMRNFHQMVAEYLRNELGCKLLINAGNWRTADNVTLLDGERWAASANEVIAINRYYGGLHEGPKAGWAICDGDRFTDESVLLQPRRLPVALKQVEGHPMLVTESSWVPPQGYQSEGPFLVAAYQSLNGVAGYFWFSMAEEAWAEWSVNSANGYFPSQGKWICHTPMLLGQWPAAALLYRQGYVRKGEPAVREERALADLFNRGMPLIAEDEGYDPNRDKGLLPKESKIKDGVDPLAYLVGPVRVRYGGDPAQSRVGDLQTRIDGAGKTVRSHTGELTWDYGRGLCTLNAPKAQGATGFLKRAGVLRLADVELHSGNDYATVLVVSLDDQPLKSSARILVQLGTTARSTGWTTRPCKIGGKEGEEIVRFGKAPWQIVNGALTLRLSNPALRRARVLDPNGMPLRELPLAAEPGGKRVEFPPDALYLILE